MKAAYDGSEAVSRCLEPDAARGFPGQWAASSVARGGMGYGPLELSGKVAVVIGGSSGIGRTLASGLAEAGADVAPSARRADQVRIVADEIEALGRRSLCVP